MKGLTDLMKQAQAMQKNIEAAQQELLAKEVIGISLAGKVRVRLNGRYNVLSVELSNDLMTEDKPVIQDAIAAAFNDAAQKIEDFSKSKMGNLMAGVELPEGLNGLT